MAENTLNIKLQARRGTSTEWASSTYVLAAGEFAFATDTNVLKVGDGAKTWAQLPTANYDDIFSKIKENFATGTANGKVKLGDKEVSVYGLKSAAYTETTAYATAAQGKKADTAYQKPTGGIAKADLASAVQTSLGKADSAYQKPEDGIPETDFTDALQKKISKYDDNISEVNAMHNSIATLQGDVSGVKTRVNALEVSIGGLTGAMHFKGKVTTLPTDLSGYANGDVVLFGTKEYVCGTVDSKKQWIELGDEGSHLTKTEAASTYLTKTAASTTYLSKTDAESTYAKPSIVDGYLKSADAATTYLSKTDAAKNYATKAQGDKADSAVQSVTTGSTSGTISVDGTNVAVKGISHDNIYEDIMAVSADVTNLDGAVLKKSGGTMTGELVLAAAPTKDLGAATKKYVDDSVAVNEVVAGSGDAVTATKSGKKVTIAHKAYSTGAMSVGEVETPYYLTGVKVEKGHVTEITANSLLAGLQALGTLTLDGGKADGTY